MLYVLSAIKSSRFTDEGYKKYASGKTTNPAFIKDYLEQHNISVVVTRESGGTLLSEKIRELLPDNENEAISNQAELLMMFAARAQHIIEPALAHVLHTLSGLCLLNYRPPSSRHGLVK